MITRKAFQEYLEGLPPWKVCGVTNSSTNCPIKVYLKTKYPEIKGIIVKRNIQINTIDLFGVLTRTMNQPEWVKNFIYKMDKLGNVQLTAGAALMLLRRN